jgi:hypothetical protein
MKFFAWNFKVEKVIDFFYPAVSDYVLFKEMKIGWLCSRSGGGDPQ